MKSFKNYVAERKGEKAHRDAVAMGLQYKGFGYWADPQTGEAKYKTVNDNLVPVEGDVESDLYKGDEAEEGPAASRGPAGSMAVPGGAAAGALPPGIGSGAGLGGPADGMLAAPPKNAGWEAGPDGDTCIGGDQAPGEVPKDTFVGKTNYVNWTAGPDGSNAMEPLELGEMRRWISEGRFEREMGRKQSADQKIADMKRGESRSQIKNVTASKLRKIFDRQGGEADQLAAAGVERPGEEQRVHQDIPHPNAGTMMRQVMGAQKMDTDGAFNQTMQQGKDAVKGMKDGGHDVILGNQIAAMMRIKNASGRYNADTFEKGADKQNDMWRKIMKLPAELKDADAVKGLNQAISGMIKNPDFDLNQFDDDEDDYDEYEDFIGEGAFGRVFDAGDAVVKKGQLGPKEIQALYALKDSPYFPDLINARFDGPFKHKSSMYNNPNNADNERRAPGESEYWDPGEQSEFDDRFPSAPGTYAMSKAKGQPLHLVWDELDEEAQENAKNQFWEARGEMHRNGLSHNDMHGGNLFVDEKGNLQIIDLGLADDNPMSALMEALGGFDYEEGEDTQVDTRVSGANIPESLRQKMTNNMESVREMIMDHISLDGDDYDDFNPEDDYSPTMSAATQRLEDMMRGGIRMSKDEVSHIGEDIPWLQDKNNIMSLIERLYDGVGQNDQQRRMSQAFKKLEDQPEVGEFKDVRDKLVALGKPKLKHRFLDFDD